VFDSTLLTILILLALATIVALIQARRRDRCLKSFEGFPVTLDRADGNLAWGTLDLYSTGFELRYAHPVEATLGHVERSVLTYKEEYPLITTIYRFPEALSGEREEERLRALESTAHPSPVRRLWRKARNWIALLRDALVQSAGLIVGAVSARSPGLAKNQAGLQQLSGEALGTATGAAYDPLLEAHLFRQVAVDLVREGKPTRTYCGWLKDYTTQFVEVVEAFANDADTLTELTIVGADAPPTGIEVLYTDGRLQVRNTTDRLFFLDAVWAEAWAASAPDPFAPPGTPPAAPPRPAERRWERTFDCLLPPGTHADITAPETDFGQIRLRMGPAGRVDLVLPRALARIRHAADGSEAQRARKTPDGAERAKGRAWKVLDRSGSSAPQASSEAASLTS
jgi:hypothetical protein